ncbi:MAG: DUF4838 domain-containing protein [bacterium]
MRTSPCIIKYLIIPLLLTLFSNSAQAQNEILTLVKNEKSAYRISIPKNAIPVELKAAEILQRYLKAISGVVLGIGEVKQAMEHQIILSSRNDAPELREVLGKLNLGEDGFLLKTYGNRLYIIGGTEKGILYGVYTFLEKYLGCRKYSPTVEIVPKKKTVQVAAFTDIQVPSIIFRDVHFHDPEYMEWHKLDYHNDVFGMYVHTFQRLVAAEKYFKEHPEYFSKVAAGRIPDGQLCLTNPDVFQIVVDELRARMKEQPEKRYWSVSQNDTFSPCECDSCKAINEREGSPSGSLLAFVNRVADQFPDNIISTLAYQYTRSAPRSIKPRPNVNIMFCSIECNRSKALEVDPGSASFCKDMEGWTRLTDNIYLWDYVVQFRNLISPFPNLRVLQPNVQYFVKNGIRSIFEQGSGELLSEFKELRTYLLAKLLWNPYLNLDSLMNDFLHGYYAAAAPYVRKYIDAMHDALEASGEDLVIYGYPLPSKNGYLSAANIDRYIQFFNQAERAVRNNPELLNRVQCARLPLQFAQLEQAKIYGTGARGFFFKSPQGTWKAKPEMEKLLETFVQRCLKNGYTAVEEMGTRPEAYLASTKRHLKSSMQHHLAIFKPVQLKTPASMKYHAGNQTALTNGLTGWEDYHMNWLGFEGKDMEAIVDLGKEVSLKSINTNFLQDINSWIFMPTEVEFSIATEGKDFSVKARLKPNTQVKQSGGIIESFSVTFQPAKSRFVRIKATSLKTCPQWHKGAGGLAWIFADEVIVK